MAGLKVDLTVELTGSGLVRAKAELTNTGGSAYTVDGLVLALPVLTEATELLDLTGSGAATATMRWTDRVYRVRKTPTPRPEPRHAAPWWIDGGAVELTGAALAAVRVQVPAQWPETAILLDVRAI